MPFGVVGPPHKVVEGHVEVVGEGEENRERRLLDTTLITLIILFSRANGQRYLLLGIFVGLSAFLKPGYKICHINTS